MPKKPQVRLFSLLKKYAIHLAFLQAWVATLGSLYFSEIRGFLPCLLCWYQRILMYPLAIIFAVALVRKDTKVYYYALPLSVVGAVIALYHYLLQMTQLKEVTPVSCGKLGLCSQTEVLYFGFITIPFLSLVAFIVITVLMLILRSKNK